MMNKIKEKTSVCSLPWMEKNPHEPLGENVIQVSSTFLISTEQLNYISKKIQNGQFQSVPPTDPKKANNLYHLW